MCAEQPRQWDRYLAPLLFAYREAPHESLGGFSPFELLFGRRVRGPMHVLKELLTKEDTETEIKTTYQYVIDLKERFSISLCCLYITGMSLFMLSYQCGIYQVYE